MRDPLAAWAEQFGKMLARYGRTRRERAERLLADLETISEYEDGRLLPDPAFVERVLDGDGEVPAADDAERKETLEHFHEALAARHPKAAMTYRLVEHLDRQTRRVIDLDSQLIQTEQEMRGLRENMQFAQEVQADLTGRLDEAPASRPELDDALLENRREQKALEARRAELERDRAAKEAERGEAVEAAEGLLVTLLGRPTVERFRGSPDAGRLIESAIGDVLDAAALELARKPDVPTQGVPPRSSRARRVVITIAVLAAVAAVTGGAYAWPLPPFGREDRESPEPAISSRTGCTGWDGAQAKADHEYFSNRNVAIADINYALSYRKDSGGSPWVYVTLFGRLSGAIPDGSHLYVIGWSDKDTWDSTGHWATGSFVWKKDHEILPDAHGCWKIPEFRIAYPGAQGVTFRYYPSVLDSKALACITALRQRDLDTPPLGEYDGSTEAEIDKCGVERLGWVSVPTERLPGSPTPPPRR